MDPKGILIKLFPNYIHRHTPSDWQNHEENSGVFDNPSFGFNSDDENQVREEIKQMDGQRLKSSLRRIFSTYSDDDFPTNDINMVGDDLPDSRFMRYFKIRVRHY